MMRRLSITIRSWGGLTSGRRRSFSVRSRGSADPALLLESCLERIADLCCDLLHPAFNGIAAAGFPVRLPPNQSRRAGPCQ